uniref:Uncharacterized protein n=1 Tax=Panagrolaimus sp. ES5 TaxID=591445 RepID=A0AC34GLF4_9BILA
MKYFAAINNLFYISGIFFILISPSAQYDPYECQRRFGYSYFNWFPCQVSNSWPIECIPPWKICDYVVDCPDGSDENDIYVPNCHE